MARKQAIIVDKAYDADICVIDTLQQVGKMTVISLKRAGTVQRCYVPRLCSY